MEEKTITLKEEELKKVSGGGSGTIPKEGITYSKYDTIISGRYYAKKYLGDELAFVYTLPYQAGGFSPSRCSYETLFVDPHHNTWTATPNSPQNDIPHNFIELYPYILNIRP